MIFNLYVDKYIATYASDYQDHVLQMALRLLLEPVKTSEPTQASLILVSKGKPCPPHIIKELRVLNAISQSTHDELIEKYNDYVQHKH